MTYNETFPVAEQELNWEVLKPFIEVIDPEATIEKYGPALHLFASRMTSISVMMTVHAILGDKIKTLERMVLRLPSDIPAVDDVANAFQALKIMTDTCYANACQNVDDSEILLEQLKGGMV